jgi:hypothetical protein
MTDIEGNTQQQERPNIHNPYSPEILPQSELLNKVSRVLYIIISGYGLEYFKFYGVVLRSPHVRHEWIKVGIATVIGKLKHTLSWSKYASCRPWS